MSQSKKHLKVVTCTWQDVQCSSVTCPVTGSESHRSSLGCGRTGDERHESALEKSARIARCSHVNMDHILVESMPWQSKGESIGTSYTVLVYVPNKMLSVYGTIFTISAAVIQPVAFLPSQHRSKCQGALMIIFGSNIHSYCTYIEYIYGVFCSIPSTCQGQGETAG